MTDQEINEAVARKLGWTDLKWSDSGGLKSELSGKRDGSPSFGETVPDYCHSIQAAWKIVEKYKTNGFKIEYESYPWDAPRTWHAAIETEQKEGAMTTYDKFEAEADTAPMAICKAFLKLP